MTVSDDDDFEPQLPGVQTTNPAQWEDEDKEEPPEQLEDKKTTTTPQQPQEQQKKAPKAKTKSAVAKKKEKEQQNNSQTPLDPETEKKRQQQLVQDSDFENTKGMFSGLDSVIDTSNPKDEKDFEVLAEQVAQKVTLFEVRHATPVVLASRNLSITSSC